MTGKVMQLLAFVCFLSILTIVDACTPRFGWSPMTIEEHLYKADIVVLATYAETVEYWPFQQDGVFNVLCVFKDDGSPIQATITIEDMHRGGVAACHGDYTSLFVGTTWITMLTRTYSGRYAWHELDIVQKAILVYTPEQIQTVASICGLQNWTGLDCPNVLIPTTCLSLATRPCYPHPEVLYYCATTELAPEQIRNVKDWGDLCNYGNYGIQSGISCIQDYYTHCTYSEAEAILSAWDYVHCFYVMMCDKRTLNSDIKNMLDDARFDQEVIDAMDLSLCLDLLNEPNLEFRKTLEIPALSCMRDVIEQAHLSEPNDGLARLMAKFFMNCTARFDNLGPTSEFYDFRSPRCNMRIWGEPHIETCNDTVTQTTCAAPGLQTYLDIYFLKITGVNTHGGGPVTFLTQVIIEFKSLVPPHAVTARYKAENKNLPSTFEFLANSVSEIDTVTLTTRPFGYRLAGGHRFVPVLVWPHTGIEIIMNIWGSFYQFTMRASQAVMNTGVGILIQGCPRDQVLSLWSIERRFRRGNSIVIKKRDEDEASARVACLAMNISSDTAEMEACIFDVVMTNDTSIAAATSMAIVDRDMIVRRDEEIIQHAGVWSLDIPSGPGFPYCIVGAKVDRCRDCVPNELLLDPTDCNRYYQCLGHGKALLQKCIPQILRFNLAAKRCDWPWNVRCQVQTIGNGP